MSQVSTSDANFLPRDAVAVLQNSSANTNLALKGAHVHDELRTVTPDHERCEASVTWPSPQSSWS